LSLTTESLAAWEAAERSKMEWEEFDKQCDDADFGLVQFYGCKHKLPIKFVIRGENGDHDIAGIHRECDTVVFDLGHKLDETS